MGRDVEIDVTAKDKTGPGIDAVAKRQEEAIKRAEAQQKRAFKNFQEQSRSLASAGGGLGALFGQNIAKGLRGAAPAAVPVLAGVAIAAAPQIGATLAAAVIGGAGGLGLVGGAVFAAKDPRIRAAYTNLGASLTDSLKSQSTGFINPLLEGAEMIRRRYNESAGDIQRLFDNASKFVRPLVDGATRGIQRIIEAASKLSSVAGPVFDAIGQGLADTLNAAAEGMESLSDNGVEAGVALRQAFQLIEVAVRGVFNVINTLTEAYGILAKLGVFGRDAQIAFLTLEFNSKLAAGGIDTVTNSVIAAEPPAATYAEKVQKIADAARELVNANRELYGSNTQVAAALEEASKKIRKNGETLNENTKKGRENRETLVQLASTLQANYDAYLKVNGAGAATTARGEQLRASFVKTAQAAGLSRRQANALADSILGIPASRTTRMRLDHEAALARAKAVRAAIQRIPTQWRTSVNIAASVTGSAASRSALNAALGKQSLRFDAMQYWSARDGRTGISRVGGPAPVAVNSTINNVVNLDGRPFRNFTASAVSESERRQRWKQRVGGRYS